MYYGDIRLNETIDVKFTSRRFSTGAPYTLAGSPVVSAYVGNGTTEITAGITLTVDFDARTGLNNVRVVASSGNGFATATNVQLVITTGTVDSVSVVGEVVGEFSIENRSAVMPTTAGRTLDVSAGGEAGVDWANVGSPTTTVGLSGTTVKTATDVEADTQDIQARLPAALTADGNIKADVLRISGDETAADNAELFFDGTGYNAANSTIGRVTTYTGNTPQTGDSYAIVNSGVHGNAAIKGYVDDIGVAGAGLSAIPWNAAWDAEVQSEVDDALIAKGLDHLVFTSVVGADIADNSIIARMASKSATADWDSFTNTTDSLEAISDIATSTGTGARTVTITVNDGSTVLQGARVRVTKGSESYIQTTPVSGVVVFNLDDGTWTVSISLAGYSFTGTTLVVDGTEAVTYSMTLVTITPSAVGATTGYLTCYSENGVVESGVTVTIQARSTPLTTTGIAVDDTVRSATSDVNGLVQFTNMLIGVSYSICRGSSSQVFTVTIPANAGATTSLTSITGSP